MFFQKLICKNRFLQTVTVVSRFRTKFTLLKPSLVLFSADKTMTSESNLNLLKPPEKVAGLTTLNHTLFEKTITVPCLIAKDVKISSIMPIMKKFLLKIENFKPVENVSNLESHIYLNPEIVEEWTDLGEETQKRLNSLNLNENNLEKKAVILKYQNYSLDSILKAVLPKNVEGTSSFTKVGHIVHVNLREHLIPYKDIIGQVLFDKVTNCRTVVNKVGNIDNTYRNFQMELLRGENDFHTQVKENKCVFEFDFSKVYWNSRLCTEHERIVKMIGEKSVIFDVFAGVGPFSVPLAKKKCHVFANDLNPESFEWLNHNFKINKISGDFFQTFNKDGKDFISGEVREFLPKFLNKNDIFIIMNLPALAVNFLSYFVRLFDDLEEIKSPPTVIVYCFAKGGNYETVARNLINENIGWDISDKIIDIFRVRTVSSMKEMMRVRFKLDREILVGHKRKHELDNSDIDAKKLYHGEKQEKTTK